MGKNVKRKGTAAHIKEGGHNRSFGFAGFEVGPAFVVIHAEWQEQELLPGTARDHNRGACHKKQHVKRIRADDTERTGIGVIEWRSYGELLLLCSGGTPAGSVPCAS